MRSVAYDLLVAASTELCEETMFEVREDLLQALEEASQREGESGQIYIDLLLQNARLARRDRVPLRQDAGVPLFMVSIGEEAFVEGGTIRRAIEEGMREAQQRHTFPLWASQQPFGQHPEQRERVEPHILMHTRSGDDVHIECMRMGHLSEQHSRLLSLPVPVSTVSLREAVVRTVEDAAANFSPPYVIGVGIGGTMAEVVGLAQRALLRPIGKPHQELEFARMEQELHSAVNALGLGPGGWGGETTALSVHVQTAPTHNGVAPVCIYLQTPCMCVGERTV